jgi:hypothetical protein
MLLLWLCDAKQEYWHFISRDINFVKWVLTFVYFQQLTSLVSSFITIVKIQV